MRIVFMGTPDFAVPSLKILVENGYNVVGVITATDKWGGRGNKKLIQSAVKQYAEGVGIKVLQPKNLKAADFQEELRSLQADLQVVVAFRMLPESVWDMPPLGTFNLHGSILPKFRGAAPIHWAVIRGERETGVTTFFIRHEIDTGDVLLRKTLPIGPDETTGEVHDRMMVLGAEAVLETVQKIESKDYILETQDHQLATKAPKLFSEMCEIDFNQPTDIVHNFIRGLSPYPAAWTNYQDVKLKIYRSARPETGTILGEPGSLHTDQKSYLHIATQDGYISVLDLQLQGRRPMSIQDFLNGFTFDI
ncbi:MAG: methionyl-tRNA formyltransferase [Bacteroidota bacterium]